MKVIAIAFAFFLAGANALPSLQSMELESAIRSGEPRLVTGNIVKAIEALAESIVEAGLDPYIIDSLGAEYAAPVPSVFNARGHIRGADLRGLSNIVVKYINYGVITSRLSIELELPEIGLSVEDSAYEVNILSGKLKGAFSGSIVLKNLAVTADMRISMGIISGISVKNMAVTAGINGIHSNVKLNLQDVDLSGRVNNYLGVSVPKALEEYKHDINELMTIVCGQVIEAYL